MFVSGHRCPEGDIAEILDGIRQSFVALVVLLPIFVTECEEFRTEGGQAEEVVGAILGHIDGQVVASEDFKIRAEFVADLQAAQLLTTIQG